MTYLYKALAFALLATYNAQASTIQSHTHNPLASQRTLIVPAVGMHSASYEGDQQALTSSGYPTGRNAFTSPPLNPYQVIYDAWTQYKALDEDELGKVRHCFICAPNTSISLGIHDKKKYSKRFLWASVFTNYDLSDFFAIAENCLYDETSKTQRKAWRSNIVFLENFSKNVLFQDLLSIDAFQDLGMIEVAFKKICDLCGDEKLKDRDTDILNVWRKAIEEENLLIFTKNTLIEAEAKNWSTDRFERFGTITKPLLTLFSGICVIILVYQLTPTSIALENSGLTSWTNSSLDVLNKGIFSNISANLSFQNETLFNITALAHKIKQPSPLSPTIIPLAIITFISVVTTFFFDGLNSLFHAIAYLFNPHIESIPTNMTQKLYEKSKDIDNTEHRKSYIKAMSPAIADTFKKCWHYKSAEKKCEALIQEKIKYYL